MLASEPLQKPQKPPQLSYWHVERRNIASGIKLGFLWQQYTLVVLLKPGNFIRKPHRVQVIFPLHACTHIYHFYVSMHGLKMQQCWFPECPGILFHTPQLLMRMLLLHQPLNRLATSGVEMELRDSFPSSDCTSWRRRENPVELRSQIQENCKPLQEQKRRADSSLSFAWNHLTC